MLLLLWVAMNSYPGVAEPSCEDNGGTGEPPDSSDGVFDRNKLPPSSDTSVIGELHIVIVVVCVFFFMCSSLQMVWFNTCNVVCCGVYVSLC